MQLVRVFPGFVAGGPVFLISYLLIYLQVRKKVEYVRELLADLADCVLDHELLGREAGEVHYGAPLDAAREADGASGDYLWPEESTGEEAGCHCQGY